MMMAQSLFINLKQQIPCCLIDVLAPDWSLALLERMPEVNRAVSLSVSHRQFGFNARLQLGRQLRGFAYDQAIVLPNSWKSALIPFFAGIKRRTGYIGEMRWGLLNDARRLDKPRLPMTVQRFVALGLESNGQLPPEYSYPKLAISVQMQRSVREKFQIDQAKKVLALCPGAEYGPAKRWPGRHFAEVAREKHLQGWQVCLFGSDKDSAVARQINDLAGGVCRDFTGRTTLGEAVDLLSLADAVVSNDSGLMHVAAALDKKLIAVYGSSDPGFTPPLHDKAVIINLKLACSPCFKRECPLGHTDCLTELLPQSVLAALDA